MVIEVGMSVVKVDVIENQLRLAIMNPADDTARVYCPAQSAEVFLDYEEATDVINSLINLQGRINGTRQRSQIEC